MGKPVIIIGAGGHARVLYDCLQLLKVNVLGALEKCPPSDVSLEIPILGADDSISKYPVDDVELVNGIGSVGNTNLRAKLFAQFKGLGYRFRILVHPSAVVAQNCELDEGVQVMAGAVINSGTKIAIDSIVNTGAVVEHGCIVGSHVHIAPRSILSGDVHVGDGAHVGTGAVIIQGVTIGEQALIGAGAVVLKDVPAGAKAVGVPARVV